MTVDELVAEMQRLAASGTDPVLLGCRPDGSLFAHHAGEEFDGSPGAAIEGLIEHRRRTLVAERSAAEAQARTVASRLGALEPDRPAPSKGPAGFSGALSGRKQ